jgi:hypothetical protein
MSTSALTRARRREARGLLAAALTVAGEGVRVAVKRATRTRGREELRRALCVIGERLAVCEAGLEPLIGELRCGYHRGRWIRELPPAKGLKR